MRDFLTALALSPLLVPQALWTGLRIARLPEAAGPRTGEMGAGPPLRLLVLGDSSAAGVGVEHQRDALGGQLAQQLADTHRVHWQVIAKSGGTAGSTLKLLAHSPPDPCDMVVIALGVNDSKNGHSLRRWTRDYAALIALVQTRTGAREILVSAVPDLGVFPALPWPLSAIIGRRARQFETALREVAKHRPHVHHMPMTIPLRPETLASDGLHPGPQTYQVWAQGVAGHIRMVNP